MGINDELLSRSISHAIFLERLKTGEQRKVLTFLQDKVYNDLTKIVQGRLRDNITTKRLLAMQKAYGKIIKNGFVKAYDGFKNDLVKISDSEALYQVNMINRLSPVQLEMVLPSATLIDQVVNKPMLGRPLRHWFRDLGGDLGERVSAQINIGLAEGETVGQMVRRIRGTRALNYTDGVIATNARNTKTIVRTAVNNAVTQARETVYRRNEDVVKGVRYVATLDSRTTVICADLDGQVFNIDEGPRPPQHHQCRSSTSPVIKSWREMGINLKEAPAGTRASLNGAVPAKTTYPEWLKKQPIAIQNEVLGKGKARLFRRGKVKFDRFVDPTGKALTLIELEALEKNL